MTLPSMTRKEVDQLVSTLQTTTHNSEMLKLAADLAAMQARAEAAEKRVAELEVLVDRLAVVAGISDQELQRALALGIKL